MAVVILHVHKYEKNKNKPSSGIGDVHTEFWWGDLRNRDHLEDKGVDGEIILKWIIKKWDEKARTGLIWLGIGTGGGRL